MALRRARPALQELEASRLVWQGLELIPGAYLLGQPRRGGAAVTLCPQQPHPPRLRGREFSTLTAGITLCISLCIEAIIYLALGNHRIQSGNGRVTIGR